MPIKDLPPVYRMDPALIEITHRCAKRGVEYMTEALGSLHDASEANDANAILAMGCEIVAAQLNVLAHELAAERKKNSPNASKELSHHDYLRIICNDTVRRSLRRHLDGAI